MAPASKSALLNIDYYYYYLFKCIFVEQYWSTYFWLSIFELMVN